MKLVNPHTNRVLRFAQDFHCARYSVGVKIFAISLLAGGFFVSFAQAAPATVYIDAAYTAGSSGGHSFGVDAFVKIQDGVNAVAPNGIVNVMAGVYDEQVLIYAKNLTLQGAGDETVVKPSSSDKLFVSYAYPNQFPIWSGARVAAIVLVQNAGAAGVVVKDLKIDGGNFGTMPFGADRFAGILYAESGGVIQSVTVDGMSTSGAEDRTYGIDVSAVYSPVSVEIAANRISNFLRNGIQALGRNLTINIHDNVVVGPAALVGQLQVTNGIVLLYGPRGEISGNTVYRLHSYGDSWQGTGIMLYGDGFAGGTIVESNEVYDADYGIGISTGASGIIVRNNNFHGNKTGVTLESGAAENRIVFNKITENLQGAQIHGPQSSNLTGNKPPGGGNVLNKNAILSNKVGIISFDDAQIFDARNNWWGSANPDFTALIVGSVNYAPWLITSDGISQSASTAGTASSAVETSTTSSDLPLVTKTEEPTQTVVEMSPLQEKETEAGIEPMPEKAVEENAVTPEEMPPLFDVEAEPAPSEPSKKTEVRTSSGNLVTRVAPGELLPISVKLVNFGGGERVDVTIDYFVLNGIGDTVLQEKETVAVETTASFIKIIQIPRDVPPGPYTAEARITYQGQKVPATANYQFTVERKIAGMFVGQFIVYSIITVLVGIVFVIVSRLIKKKLRVSRLTPHEYPEIPKEERIFYEIVSDIIAQMRYRVGDKALDIARGIDDLVVDESNGKVLKVKKSPAKIIALLILKYEKLLGQKISFVFPKPNDKTKDHLATVEKNLIVIRKYFE